MKSISELRSEIESRGASTVGEANFGTDLVGRLLSPDEVEMVAGSGDSTCYSGSTTHSQTGSGSYGQTGGQYFQDGAGGYTMNCT